MPKLRVFVVSSWSRLAYQKKQKGFAGTSEYHMLRCFVKNGHEVHLLMPKEKAMEDSSYSGISIHEFKMPSIPPAKNPTSRLVRRLIHYFLFIFFSTKCLMKTAKDYGKPNVVYGFTSHGCVTAYIANKLWRVPNITRLYGTFLYPYLSNSFRLFFSHFEEVLAFKLACRYLIITNDGTRGDEVARAFRVPSERVKYWMNGTNFLHNANIGTKRLREELQIPKEAHVVISVCRLAPWKGVDRLIRAVPAVVSTDSNVRVLIIGEGEDRENLEHISETLSIKKFVNFLGTKAHEDVKKYLLASDIFVSLNDFSNISSALLEAMACGVCVVVLNSGATSHVIKNKENGILINYDELQNLSATITNLTSNNDLRIKLGNNARQYALKNFKTWDERFAMEVKLIESLFTRR